MGFDTLLVTHASPTLANMKPASLISLSRVDDGFECISKLEMKGLSFLQLRNAKHQDLVLVYRKDKLEQALSSPQSLNFCRVSDIRKPLMKDSNS